ncbi:MAG: leucyl/phenylalanyl-tRNA--protein transferase [Gammaproteobacteria bacterium]|jgi:leucyl/phenylalanyl-tRNA--protein transferase
MKSAHHVPQLAPFPPLTQADEHGLLAMGGDLTAERLKLAYQSGIFPWYEAGQPILWWSPDPRCILIPSEFKATKSLLKSIRKHAFHCSFDTSFAQVIDHCAAPRYGTAGTWITSEMRDAYINLHELGVAHSVEVWSENELVGGLYGISLGKMFYGESMFSLQADASKAALKFLCESLKEKGYPLIDCQVSSGHLLSLGAQEIKRKAFIKQMKAALNNQQAEVKWGANHDNHT